MDIPEELVTEILVRLPAKSLVRFRCVCKSWCALIKSPSFVDLHSKHPSQKTRKTDYLILAKKDIVNGHYHNTFMSFYSRDKDGGMIPAHSSLPVFNHQTYTFRISGPCNGIICIVDEAYRHHDTRSIYSCRRHDTTSIYLCNPATHECQKIPKSPIGFPPDRYGTACPIICASGFGFDPRTDEYKVVLVNYCEVDTHRDYYDLDGMYKVEIYELRSNSWREVETVLPDEMVIRRDSDGVQFCEDHWDGSGLFFNGCLHWRFQNRFTISFDISDEKVRLIFDPPNQNNLDGKVVVFEDCLAILMVVFTSDQSGSVCLWVMTEYGVQESWSKRFSIPLPSDLFCIETYYYSSVISVICWNDDVLLVRDGKLFVCNLSGDDRQFKLVDASCYLLTGAVIISSESLVSVR